MATRINALPVENNPVASEVLALDGSTTRSVTIQKVVDTGAPVASQAEAEAGVNNVKRMTPLTTVQALSAQIGVTIASQAAGELATSALQPTEVGTTIQPFSERLQEITIASGTTGQVLALQPDDTLAFTNAGAGDMITAQYDPDAIGANAFDAGNQVDFVTTAIASKSIPAPVNSFWTSGYADPGDDGEAQFKRIPAPSPEMPWHFQSSDGAWFQIAEKTLFPERLGAFTGAADNANALLNLFDAAFALGCDIDGRGRSYTHLTNLVRSGVMWTGTLRNITLISPLSAGDKAVDLVGPGFDAAASLTANASARGNTVAVPNGAAFPVGSAVLLDRDGVWAVGATARPTIWRRVVSVSGNTLTIDAPLPWPFNTADNATIKRLLPGFSPVFDNRVRIERTGTTSASAAGGLYVTYAISPEARHVQTLAARKHGMAFVQCYAPVTGLVEAWDCDSTGFGYPVSISGCGAFSVGRTIAHRCRHAVLIGEASNILSTDGAYGDIQAFDCKSAPIDFHPGSYNCHGKGIVSAQFAATYAGEDALVMQGYRLSIGHVSWTGYPARHGALFQSKTNDIGQVEPNILSIESIEGDALGGTSSRLISATTEGTRGIDAIIVGRLRGAAAEVGINLVPTTANIERVLLPDVSITSERHSLNQLSNNDFATKEVRIGGNMTITTSGQSHFYMRHAGGFTPNQVCFYTGGRVKGATNAARIEANCELYWDPNVIRDTISGADSVAAGAIYRGAIFRGSTTYDPPSLAAGAKQQTTVTVTGALVGFQTIATFSNANAGIRWSAEITGANTATVTMENVSASAVDLASGTLVVVAERV